MKKLAIVGSGISAMTVAHYLRNDFEISIFEKNDYLGGHTHTHNIIEAGKEFTIDTGFIVFNEENYPNLIKLFDSLGVEKRKSNMSFSVANLKTGLEYAGTNYDTLFAQRKNLVSPKYWSFLRDITRFFQFAKEDCDDLSQSVESIDKYCQRKGLSRFFVDNYLAPMTAAVWSMEQKQAKEFPISLLIPFFKNHGLLGMDGQYQWYTLKGGSNMYIKKIIEKGSFDIHKNEKVQEVGSETSKVYIKTGQASYNDFDYCVLACHSDQALAVSSEINKERADILRKFAYTKNLAVLHSDKKVMPKNKKVWSAWNQIFDGRTSTVYWVNNLQDIPVERDYFISINPFQDIDEKKVIKKIEYFHPNFSVENYALQDKLSDTNKNSNILLAGAYMGYGFHEDGHRAGLNVVDILKQKY